jgi:hypothetical protein
LHRGGIPNPTAAITALGLGARFDLSDACWYASGTECSGTLTALHRLGRIDKVDPE